MSNANVAPSGASDCSEPLARMTPDVAWDHMGAQMVLLNVCHSLREAQHDLLLVDTLDSETRNEMRALEARLARIRQVETDLLLAAIC